MAKKENKGMKLLALAGGVALMVVAWRFPIPLVIVPGDTKLLSLIAVVMGVLLGWADATLIATLYVVLVIFGIPPLLWHIAPDPTPFFDGPGNGLVLGLIAAAYVAARIAPRGMHDGLARVTLAVLAGHLVYLAAGIAWRARLSTPLEAAHFMVETQLFAVIAKSAIAVLAVWGLGRFVKR